ncbi:30194_t:CDS:1, partial [Racocetra persica]
EFRRFADAFQAKLALGDTPSMVSQDLSNIVESPPTITSLYESDTEFLEIIEPSPVKQKEKKSQGRRQRQKKTSKKVEKQKSLSEPTTTLTTSQRPQAQRQRTPKDVSVNNISSLKYLPMYVWKSLDRGAKFQLTKYCTYQQCQKDWQETKVHIEKELARLKSRDVSAFFVNRNVLDISFNVIKSQLFNKEIFKRNRFHKSKFGINKDLERCFKYLVWNDLVVLCADKNMGLTIMDYEWYNYEVHKHL